MWITCDHTNYMPIMVQIRNVPDELHRKMKSRAALAGKSLSDYLLAELREIAERPSLDELRARLAARSGFTPSIPSADVIRVERDRG
jgi:plasmid stability protein